MLKEDDDGDYERYNVDDGDERGSREEDDDPDKDD